MRKTFLILFLLVAIFIACEKDEPASPYNPGPGGKIGHNPPTDHTVNKHGYMHKSCQIIFLCPMDTAVFVFVPNGFARNCFAS